jgi:hypothetical protein
MLILLNYKCDISIRNSNSSVFLDDALNCLSIRVLFFILANPLILSRVCVTKTRVRIGNWIC